MGQVVLLRGEAGIGKSRLVERVRECVLREGATRIAFRCSPYHQTSALYPLIDHLQRFLHWQRDATPEARFDTLEQVLRTYRFPLEEVVPLFAALLSVPLPERYPLLHLTPQRQRQKTHEALVAWLLEEAERQPVLAVWEDLHWADPSTLEVLSLLLDQAQLEVERVYSRAQELCQQIGEPPESFRALWGLRTVHYLRAELQMALECGRQLLRLALRQQDTGFLVEAHRSLGTTLYNRGETLAARTHLGQALALYDPQQHRSHVFLYGQDPAMACLTYDAMALWLLGYPQQALRRSHEALTVAENAAHPYSLAFALGTGNYRP
jgi:tetratricopeptide (TPR) repeat protein